MKVRMWCTICGAEATIDVPVQKYEELEVVPVPDYYCARCKILVDVIIDGVAEKEDGKD